MKSPGETPMSPPSHVAPRSVEPDDLPSLACVAPFKYSPPSSSSSPSSPPSCSDSEISRRNYFFFSVMAASKLLIVSIVALLVLSGARADAGAIEVKNKAAEAPDSPVMLDLEQFRSKISTLESSISDRVRELKSKNDGIIRLENIVQEKSASIASLRSEIELILKKDSVDVEELVGRAHTRAGELEKQVEVLKNNIEAQSRKKDALEVRAGETEKKLQELNSKLKSLQKTNDEQKHRIRKTERALKVAEEELMRAQLEATSRSEELTEIHGAWLPPWLTTHINYCQDLVVTHWNGHAKPALNAFLQKASEKSAQAQKWAEPHFETAKTKWIPAAKEQVVISVTYVEPHVRTICAKTIKFCEASKIIIASHIAKVQEVANPYFQEIKKFSKPYIDQVVLISKPHFKTVRVVLKPYTKRLVRAYRKFRKSTTVYHHQVQATVMETLKKHELTKPLATKELVWFTASALLAFPIFFLYRLLAAIFCNKTRKPTRNAHSAHVSRRHKRRHADK